MRDRRRGRGVNYVAGIRCSVIIAHSHQFNGDRLRTDDVIAVVISVWLQNVNKRRYTACSDPLPPAHLLLFVFINA